MTASHLGDGVVRQPAPAMKQVGPKAQKGDEGTVKLIPEEGGLAHEACGGIVAMRLL